MNLTSSTPPPAAGNRIRISPSSDREHCVRISPNIPFNSISRTVSGANIGELARNRLTTGTTPLTIFHPSQNPSPGPNAESPSSAKKGFGISRSMSTFWASVSGKGSPMPGAFRAEEEPSGEGSNGFGILRSMSSMFTSIKGSSLSEGPQYEEDLSTEDLIAQPPSELLAMFENTSDILRQTSFDIPEYDQQFQKLSKIHKSLKWVIEDIYQSRVVEASYLPEATTQYKNIAISYTQAIRSSLETLTFDNPEYDLECQKLSSVIANLKLLNDTTDIDDAIFQCENIVTTYASWKKLQVDLKKEQVQAQKHQTTQFQGISRAMDALRDQFIKIAINIDRLEKCGIDVFMPEDLLNIKKEITAAKKFCDIHLRQVNRLELYNEADRETKKTFLEEISHWKSELQRFSVIYEESMPLNLDEEDQGPSFLQMESEIPAHFIDSYNRPKTPGTRT